MRATTDPGVHADALRGPALRGDLHRRLRGHSLAARVRRTAAWPCTTPALRGPCGRPTLRLPFGPPWRPSSSASCPWCCCPRRRAPQPPTGWPMAWVHPPFWHGDLHHLLLHLDFGGPALAAFGQELPQGTVHLRWHLAVVAPTPEPSPPSATSWWPYSVSPPRPSWSHAPHLQPSDLQCPSLRGGAAL